MSMVPTYVLATDGKFYKNPVLGDTDNTWFLCFDDDDPPELVIRHTNPARPEEILKAIGVTATVKRSAGGGLRCFSRQSDRNLKMHRARAWFLRIHKPIPVASITEHDGAFPQPIPDCVSYSFDRE